MASIIEPKFKYFIKYVRTKRTWKNFLCEVFYFL